MNDSPLEFLDHSTDSPAENVALDEALLIEREEQAKADGDAAAAETLRIWESPVEFVVLGVAGRVADEVERAGIQYAGVPVVRRPSGGGTVLQGIGCLNFALVLSIAARGYRDFHKSYREILGVVATALDIPGINFSGTSDLALGERKFSGNAQKRKRFSLLHHGTLLYDFDIERVSQFLTEPRDRPDYRGTRNHDQFLLNLPLTRNALVRRLRNSWGANTPRMRPLPDLSELVREKYGNVAWNERF